MDEPRVASAENYFSRFDRTPACNGRIDTRPTHVPRYRCALHLRRVIKMSKIGAHNRYKLGSLSDTTLVGVLL